MGKNFYDEITSNEEQRGENFFDEVTPKSKSSCEASKLPSPEDNSGKEKKKMFTTMEVAVPVYEETDGYNIPILI